MDGFQLTGRERLYEIRRHPGEKRSLARAIVKTRLSQRSTCWCSEVRVNGHGHHILKPKSAFSVSREDTICIEEIRTNFSTSDGHPSEDKRSNGVARRGEGH